MWKTYFLCFDSQSDRPETSTKITFHLTMVDVTCQEETVFEVVNLNVLNYPETMSSKVIPYAKTTTDSSHDTALQSMSNESIELTHRLVNSYEEHFSQPNHDRLAAMRARPLFCTNLI